jgi:phosphopantothenoylcysteine decarboxylase/phosphopantothenate--cysteine ligase
VWVFIVLKERKILLGISGGIAAYKCAELVRMWTQSGAEVEVVMTAAAQKFITPLTMETLIGKQIHSDLFPENQFSATVHIDLADWADVVVIAPATANIISKIRHAQGDDLLTTICLAAWRKIVIAPAMNSNMWHNPIVQDNLKVLAKHGYSIIQPTEGDLACGYSGMGRLPDPEIIDYWVRYKLHLKSVLKDKTVLITASRTEEEIDPVRILTNRSSGKMGYALAEEAFFHGAQVILVAGPNNLDPLPGIEYHPVVSAMEMQHVVNEHLDRVDIIIASAAVADYRSKEILFRKMKKNKKEKSLNLAPNPDILADIGKRKAQRILVGFAVETENEEENALKKLRQKNLDMIVLNNPVEEGSGFGGSTNRVTIFKKRGKAARLPLMSKREVAVHIIDEIIKLLGKSVKAAQQT